MKKVMIIIAAMFAVACGKIEVVEEHTPPTPPPVTAPTIPAIDTVQADIDAIVSEENYYRVALGQAVISEGLSCSVQEVSSGQRISSSSSPSLGSVITTTGPSYTYTFKGVFNQPNSQPSAQNMLLPAGIRPLFVGKNYVMRCNGLLVVRDTGYYSFELNSDDGSILTVDNSVVINNDGNHGMTLKVGTKFLRRGVKQFRLEYAQTGGGQFGLVLTSGSSAIDARNFYR